MNIPGTNAGEPLTGTEEADVITALGGNDTVNALGGDDVIFGGLGVDRLFGGEGSDTFVEDQPVSFVFANTTLGTPEQRELFDGGNGFDTIELRVVPVPVVTGIGSTSFHGLNLTTLVSIERLVFASTAGSVVQASLTVDQAASSGLTQVVGGAGQDFISFSGSVGVLTMPTLQLINWSAAPLNAWENGRGDFLVLSAPNQLNSNNTLNAAAGLTSFQALSGGIGNDTLNGSANADSLNGGGGINMLFGNGGNDVLAINNTALPPSAQNPFPQPTMFTGAGSVFDGGEGFDLLAIGGNVEFQGTLVSIEGVTLQPAFTPPQPNTISQAAAVLNIDSAHLAMLPTDAYFRGTGTVQVDLSGGASFDGSAYRFEAGSNVTFFIDGEFDGFTGTATYVGTSNGDRFSFGEGRSIATGGGGADLFEPGEGDTTITDFTPGVDKLDFSDSDITGFQRLADFIVSTGPDLVIRGESGGEVTMLTLQGISLAQLDIGRDFVFATGGFAISATAGPTDDLLFGFELNDQLRGGEGNDRLYGGGGVDKLFGEGGHDTLILDGLVGINSSAVSAIYDGGTGFDTLEARTAGINFTSLSGGFTSYGLAGGSFTGIERLAFASTAQNGILVTVLASSLAVNQTSIGGPLELVGGAGNDTFVSIAFSTIGGTFTIPALTLSNWTTATEPYRAAGGDIVALLASGAGDFVLNAREGLAANQALLGGVGNDVLNGSSGVDLLNGNGGINQLSGNGGNDALIIANTVVQTGQTTFATTTFNGFGSNYDGGSGFDVLSVGGTVDFLGDLESIEGIYLQSAFASPNPGGAGSQGAALLLLPGHLINDLPANLSLDGTGTVAFDLDPGDVYDGSAFVVRAGSNVTVHVTGSSANDTIVLGGAREVVDDDGGIDTAVFAGTRASYTFGVGANGEVLIGDDVFQRIELFRFADGVFGFDGVQLVPVGTGGKVADGYIAGATVWIDIDGDGTRDPDEPFAISDAAGNFNIASNATGPLRAIGGTNIDTGLANTLLLSAPDGAGVINPLTTLIEALIDENTTAQQAEAAVEAALGLDPLGNGGLDLTQLDLIAAAATDPAALEAQKAAAAVAEVIGAVTENGGDQGDALDALADLIDDGGTVDLTATETLTTVIGAGLPGEDVAALVAETQAVTEAIDDAESLDEVTEVQGNVAPTAVDDRASVDEDEVVTGNVIVGSDSDSDAGQMLNVTAVDGAALTGQPIQGLYGTLTIAANGAYRYVADADVVDAFAPDTPLVESFDYAISDGTGGIASATLTFDITTVADNRTLPGGNGIDRLSGTGMDEFLFGGRGDDILAGNGGADRLYGEQGADMLSGGDGFDLLIGGQGNDRLFGDAGSDLLVGGKGADLLFGGSGADVFEFGDLGTTTDRDIIGDFELGVDAIHLSNGLTVTGVSQTGESTVLTLSNGGSILLQGVHAEGLGGLLTPDLPDWSAGLPLI